jgi:hypothetical protein
MFRPSTELKVKEMAGNGKEMKSETPGTGTLEENVT